MQASKIVPIGLIVVGLTAMGGCASIMEGSKQPITIETEPADARCELLREGRRIALARETPQTLHVEKSRKDIEVICTKDGYEDATAVLTSEFEAWTVGNIILGGPIGVGWDAASGAMNIYPGAVLITLPPE